MLQDVCLDVGNHSVQVAGLPVWEYKYKYKIVVMDVIMLMMKIVMMKSLHRLQIWPYMVYANHHHHHHNDLHIGQATCFLSIWIDDDHYHNHHNHKDLHIGQAT